MKKTSNEAKRPSHTIFQVIGEGEKARWNRVGAAWQNKDNKGLNLVFDCLPLSGRVVVRAVSEKEGSDGNGATMTPPS